MSAVVSAAAVQAQVHAGALRALAAKRMAMALPLPTPSPTEHRAQDEGALSRETSHQRHSSSGRVATGRRPAES
jgi:hypothetical protein